jgi:hypothetical protein
VPRIIQCQPSIVARERLAEEPPKLFGPGFIPFAGVSSMNEQRIVAKALTSAPVVVCPGCFVEMTLRHMAPAPSQKLYTGCYRCPKCGTDTKREFAIDAEYALERARHQ